jgi:hypothetical protein
MKILYLILVLFLCVCTDNCIGQIKIGDSSVHYKLIPAGTSYVTSSTNIEKGYIVWHNRIKYIVTLSENHLVHFISTWDSKFKTEGLKVGSFFSDIENADSSHVINYRGWGKVIKLNSGWNAVFDFKKPITKFSKIQFFFKK